MQDVIFTTPWLAAWARELNASQEYRRAARDWEGSLCLRMTSETPQASRAVFLDLSHGECREARLAEAEDVARAHYVLAAGRKTWHRLLEGHLDPLWGLMTGRLKLERGTKAELAGHAAAARELLTTAQRIDLAELLGTPEPSAPSSAPRAPTPSPGQRRHPGTAAAVGSELVRLPLKFLRLAKQIGRLSLRGRQK